MTAEEKAAIAAKEQAEAAEQEGQQPESGTRAGRTARPRAQTSIE